MLKKFLKPILIILIILVLVVGGYFAYVLLSYYRLEDNLSLEISGDTNISAFSDSTTYRITSANLGFGAYSADYSFFMDGGTESWAYSKEAVNENITGSVEAIESLDGDIMLFQELKIVKIEIKFMMMIIVLLKNLFQRMVIVF